MSVFLRAAILAVSLLAASTFAADPEKPSAPPASPPAKLEIGGRHIVTFRASFAGYRPEDRVEGARTRLFAAYEKNPHLSFTSHHIPEGSQVLANGAVMFVVAPGDVNASVGETTEQIAAHAIDVMRQIIEERRERRDAAALARGAGFAVVATLVAYLLLRLVFALDRRLGSALSRRAAERAQRLRVSGVNVVEQSVALRATRLAVRWTAWAIAAFLAFLWLNAVLQSLPFTRPWGEKLTDALLDALASVGGAILDAVPGLILVVVILAAARLAAQATTFFLDRVEERDMRLGWLHRHTAKPTRIVVTLLIWIFAVAMAYPYLPGSESRAFQGLSVLVGVMVSIGASNIVGQAASGLILMYTGTYRVGEYIRVQDIEGTVIELGIFATRVRTGLGDEVVLPSSLVLGNVSRNYSRAAGGDQGFVVATSVTIGYDTPWRQVEALLKEAASRTSGVATDPAPRVFKTNLSDFYVEYRMSAVCPLAGASERADTMSRLHGNVLDVFNEHDVQIMSPHYLSDPDGPKVVPRADWFRAPAKNERPGS